MSRSLRPCLADKVFIGGVDVSDSVTSVTIERRAGNLPKVIVELFDEVREEVEHFETPISNADMWDAVQGRVPRTVTEVQHTYHIAEEVAA